MRQLVTVAPRRVEFRDAPEPVPAIGDAVVAVEAVGICGSDVHFYTGEHPYSRFPNVQGHEFAGRVLSVPADYKGEIHVGQRVAVEPLLMCGHCLPCRRGRGNCCVNMRTLGAQTDGALSERIAVPVNLLYPVDDLPPDLAALVEPVSIGLHAVKRSGLQAGDLAVAYGAGPIGQAILLAAQDCGARLLVIDLEPKRLALAAQLGAEAVINPREEEVAERVAAWTGGDGPVVVFEATGVPSVLRAAIDLVAPSGTVVVVGLSTESVPIPMVLFTRKELAIVGSRNNAGVFGLAVELVRRNRDRASRLISHRFPFDRAPDAFELAYTSPATTEKVMITFSQP
jgi:threonine dehydrogenase-like Zn-dependent dehydrogenase